MSSIDKGLYDRLIGNSLTQQAESQRELDSTIARLTSRSPDVADSYRTAPQPGHGPGMYQPRARATGKDVGHGRRARTW